MEFHVSSCTPRVLAPGFNVDFPWVSWPQRSTSTYVRAKYANYINATDVTRGNHIRWGQSAGVGKEGGGCGRVRCSYWLEGVASSQLT